MQGGQISTQDQKMSLNVGKYYYHDRDCFSFHHLLKKKCTPFTMKATEPYIESYQCETAGKSWLRVWPLPSMQPWLSM